MVKLAVIITLLSLAIGGGAVYLGGPVWIPVVCGVMLVLALLSLFFRKEKTSVVIHPPVILPGEDLQEERDEDNEDHKEEFHGRQPPAVDDVLRELDSIRTRGPKG